MTAGRLFLLSDNQNGMTAVPVAEGVDDVGLLRGDVAPVKPVAFRQHHGKVPRDLVMGGSVAALLISEHVRSILEEGSFTGWATYPVLLVDRRGSLIPGYHGLVVTGRSRSASPRQLRAAIARGDVAEMGWRLRADADIYLDGAGSAIVVTRAVAEALRAGKVTNLHLTGVA